MNPQWRAPHLWGLFLTGPVAWSAVFGVLLFLTHPACESGNRRPMGFAGIATAAVVLAAVLISRRALRDELVARVASLRFLAGMALWGNALFLLVIALTVFPVSMLSPCGV